MLPITQPERALEPAQPGAAPEHARRAAPQPTGPADDALDAVESGEARRIPGRQWKDRAPALGVPPPPLALHPTAADGVNAPLTPGAGLAGGTDMHQGEPSWPAREAGLSRTPSYPSTCPTSAASTALPTGGSWLAGFKRALHKLKREVKALNYAVQVV